ncbi:unknown [Prevotella sp. CAG:755]|nr:unknown [Prevotella sp. CAG:755]
MKGIISKRPFLMTNWTNRLKTLEVSPPAAVFRSSSFVTLSNTGLDKVADSSRTSWYDWESISISR